MLFVRAHLHMRETFRPSVGQMVAVAQRCLSDGPARPGPAGRKQWSWSEASLAGVFELRDCDHHPIFHIVPLPSDTPGGRVGLCRGQRPSFRGRCAGGWGDVTHYLAG